MEKTVLSLFVALGIVTSGMLTSCNNTGGLDDFRYICEKSIKGSYVKVERYQGFGLSEVCYKESIKFTNHEDMMDYIYLQKIPGQDIESSF